jgi:hypothetical protein
VNSFKSPMRWWNEKAAEESSTMKLLRRRFLHLDRIGNKDEGLHRLFLYLFERVLSD